MIPLRVGILGGGQLAQMLALAAYELGVRPSLLIKDEQECATQVTSTYFLDDGSDGAVQRFLDNVDVVTIENEFIDIARFKRLFGEKKIFPRFDTLKLVQNKLDQKTFLKKNKIPSLDFIEINSIGDLESAYSKMNGSIVIKQARLGYDGRGTFIFQGKKDAEKFGVLKKKLSEGPMEDFGYAEPFALFKKEIAIVVARSESGEIRSYPIIETHQEAGICHWAVAPCEVSSKIKAEALSIAQKVVKKLEGVGVFAIEMFILGNNKVVINEIAPRVHNSGHLTINSTLCNQFEQHLRAIAGMPLGDSTLKVTAAAMVNIIGTQDKNLDPSSEINANLGLLKEIWVHWYGKAGFTRDRKLGHINSIGKTVKETLSRAQKARGRIQI